VVLYPMTEETAACSLHAFYVLMAPLAASTRAAIFDDNRESLPGDHDRPAWAPPCPTAGSILGPSPRVADTIGSWRQCKSRLAQGYLVPLKDCRSSTTRRCQGGLRRSVAASATSERDLKPNQLPQDLETS